MREVMKPDAVDARLTLAKGLGPFLGAAVLAWAAMAVTSSVHWTQYAISIALLIAGGGLACLRRSSRAWLGIVPASLILLAAIGVLRNSAGGMTSGAATLALIPVFYTALHAQSRRAMVIVLTGLAVFYLAPLVLIGAPQYPDSQYRTALLSVAVSSIVGFATQALVSSVRVQAAEAQSRGQMLEQVSATVRGLFVSRRARIDVCESAMRISEATAALLYEPGPDPQVLRCTATSGFAQLDREVSAGPQSAVYRAFRSGGPVLVSDNLEAQVGSPALWIAAGRPASVLYEPLMKDGVALGVLVVAWPDTVRPDGPRVTVAALLAHEAAAVIDRADAIQHLTGEARTDPLTGLPNRRAWDAALRRAAGQDQTMTVALLDLDHFKEFNDTYGHPAGDRLLKETAAAWRDQLRPGDLLTRIGGEEFALLLDCDAGDAAEVLERLRDNVSAGRTCSAGLAVRRSEESLDSVVARADRALYRAKAAGRDRIHQSA